MIKKLEDTVKLMTSKDYKDRFRAEFWQLKIRLEKLYDMCDKWDKGELDFTPTCSREVYDRQIYFMEFYLEILIERAVIEEVYFYDLPEEEE